MSKRTKGTLYRKTVTRVRRGKRVKSKSGFYRVRCKDANGKPCDHVLILPNGGKTTDKDVAQSVFNKLLKQVDREAAGLVDPMIQAAGSSIRKMVANYLRYKKRQRMTFGQLDQIRYSLKRIIVGMDRLSDFNEASIEKVLRTLIESGKSARTVNTYRTHARGFGK